MKVGLFRMLKEVYSTAFKTYGGAVREPIKMNAGLNVVLGTNDGANSIGKSSFLMVLDYIFGGDDYIDKCPDIQDNVKGHTICFTFEWDGEEKYFSRSTIDSNNVNICNENYEVVSTISIKKYRNMLAEAYGTGCEDQSFRGMVSTYFRIYQRDNLDEKKPLDVAKKAKDQGVIDEIIKLFGRFDYIKQLREQEANAKDLQTTLSKSMKHELVPKITERQYKSNVTQIETLNRELENLANASDEERLDMIGVEKESIDEISRAKEEVVRCRRQYSKIRAEYRAICNNTADKFVGFDEDIELLQDFFPGVDVRRISEIEAFHKKLEGILSQEIDAEKVKIQLLLDEAKSAKESAERELARLSHVDRVSEKLVSRVTEIKAELDLLQRANDVHEKKKDCKVKIEDCREQGADVIRRQLEEIEKDLNIEMERLNEYIYTNGRKAPMIHFSDAGDTYTFRTPNDSGTGTSCRGLILFDLAVMTLTNLPVLIHDSVIHKQIEDHAFGKLLDLYEKSGRQVFIAMDKQSSFGNEVEKTLENAAILHLSKNGNELYGRPWYE